MSEAESGDPECSEGSPDGAWSGEASFVDDGASTGTGGDVVLLKTRAAVPGHDRDSAQGRPVTASPAASPAEPMPVTFDQAELRLIFGLYGRKVANGEWRDYALDFLREQAIFSVYRRSSEVPLYRIEKTPRLARKQGQYAAVAASGLILKRGADLARVLGVLDKPLRVVR